MGCPKYVKERCYTTLVRPTMEYACAMWDPYTQSNVKKIEMIQRRAARFICRKYRKSESPSEMIKDLGWEPLVERCAKLKAAMMFKIQNNIVDIPKDNFTEVGTHNRRSQAVVLVPAA